MTVSTSITIPHHHPSKGEEWKYRIKINRYDITRTFSSQEKLATHQWQILWHLVQHIHPSRFKITINVSEPQWLMKFSEHESQLNILIKPDKISKLPWYRGWQQQWSAPHTFLMIHAAIYNFKIKELTGQFAKIIHMLQMFRKEGKINLLLGAEKIFI